MREVRITSAKLWLDDVHRPPSEDWTWVKSVDEALALLLTGSVAEVSLDNDLHPFEHDGLEVCEWMEEHGVWPEVVHVHTDNRFASTKMCNLLERNGYKTLPGQIRSFRKAGEAKLSPREFATLSHRGSPKAMERFRQRDEDDSERQ